MAYTSNVHLLTDSSSARQLAAKQGVGKVRHLDGKILWIQQHVLSGDVQLQQLPTVWNVSDLCTKALTQQRVKLLLHELNVCDDAGLTVIGLDEHDQQSERNGSKRQMMKLAKNLTRIFSLMGLGPSGAAGQGIFPDGEDTGICSVASMSPPCVENETTHDFPWMLCFCIFLSVISWVIFAGAAWKVYKWFVNSATTIEREHYHLSVQAAELDTAFGEIQTSQGDMGRTLLDHDRRLARLEHGLGETARDLDFVQDYSASIHYGLVEMGGFRRFGELTPDHNRAMYQRERGNMVSFNVMGGERYLRLACQQTTGIHAHTDNTDDRRDADENEEGGESETPMEVDNEIRDVNTREHLVNRLRALLNEALAREEFRDGAVIQQLIMLALNLEPGRPIGLERFNQLLENVITELQNRHQRSVGHSQSTMADVYEIYIGEFMEQLSHR